MPSDPLAAAGAVSRLRALWPRLEGWQKNQLTALAMGWTQVEHPPRWWKAPNESLRRHLPLPFATQVSGIEWIAHYCAAQSPVLHWTISSGLFDREAFGALLRDLQFGYCAMVGLGLSVTAPTAQEALAFALCVEREVEMPSDWFCHHGNLLVSGEDSECGCGRFLRGR